MSLKIYSINSMSIPWIKDTGCALTQPSEADFIVYEQNGDQVEYTIDLLKRTFPKEKLVFILSGDIRVTDDEHIWFVNNCVKQTDKIHQIYMHNPRIWSYTPTYNFDKKIFGHFSGTIWDSPERLELKELSSRWEIIDTKGYWELPSNKKIETSLKSYKRMEESIYTLCPRGNGLSSMRILEALACGSIPILINDFTNPFNENYEDLVIRVTTSEIKQLDNIIDSKPEPTEEDFRKCIDFWKDNICNSTQHLPWSVASGFAYKIVNILKDIKNDR